MSTFTRPTGGVTFAVHDVDPAADLLPVCKTHEGLKKRLRGALESCCDYSADCVADVWHHPLIAATHLAFSQHRPLVLSPDMIWITIVQGVAQHVANNAERLRHLLVRHSSGKREIVIRRPDFVIGSPENPWPEVFSSFSEAIRDEVGDEVHRLFVADFSTTGPVERAVSEVVLMDVFQPYFSFGLRCVCGVPSVTLEGTAEDWRRLRQKVDLLERFDLDWWLKELRPICDHFVRAAEGDVDRGHWQNVYKLMAVYGAELINGWMGKLFPYLQNPGTGSYTRRNPLLLLVATGEGRSGVVAGDFPSGVSEVPFTLTTIDRQTKKERQRAMQFVAGSIGITQDAQTKALRPKLGWAVREAGRLDQLLLQARGAGGDGHEVAAPLPPEQYDEALRGLDAFLGIPDQLFRFYRLCNGLNLFGGVYRFCSLAQLREPVPVISLLDWLSPGATLLRLCRFSDGSFACADLYESIESSGRFDVILYEGQTQDAEVPVIAHSLPDLLERALASGGRLYFREPGFVPLGTARVGPSLSSQERKKKKKTT